MKIKKSSVLIVAAMFVIACSSTKLIQPQQADAERGSQMFAGLSVAELDHGKAIFEQNCNLCHPLKKPESRSADQWKKIVPVMVEKTNKKQGKEAVDANAKETLLKYLITMSTAPSKKG